MKIIISRKGFDSKYGGCPSPIFNGRRMLSLPIPANDGISANDIFFDNEALGQIISDLTFRKLDGKTLVHLDPDLDRSAIKHRSTHWRAAFGQAGAAQAHLRNQGVRSGDLFLFFGWFEHALRTKRNGWTLKSRTGFHSLFGWLQVGAVFDVRPDRLEQLPAWLRAHPHADFAEKYAGLPNVIYVCSEELTIGGVSTGLPGAGIFQNWTREAMLTASGETRSVWSVPKWMDWRTTDRPPLTYHAKSHRWSDPKSGVTDKVMLQSAAIGQEFVFCTDAYPEALPWSRKLIEIHATA